MSFLSDNEPQEVPNGDGLTKSRRATVSPCSAASCTEIKSEWHLHVD